MQHKSIDHKTQLDDKLKGLLKTGADIDEQDENGDTALHRAARNNPVEFNPCRGFLNDPDFDHIEILLANGANPLIKNKQGEIAAQVIFPLPLPKNRFDFDATRRQAKLRKRFFTLLLGTNPQLIYLVEHMELELFDLSIVRPDTLSLDCIEHLMIWCDKNLADYFANIKAVPGEKDTYDLTNCRFNLRELRQLKNRLEQHRALLITFPGLLETIAELLKEEHKTSLFTLVLSDEKYFHIFGQFLELALGEELFLSQDLIKNIKKLADEYENDRAVLAKYPVTFGVMDAKEREKMIVLVEKLEMVTSLNIYQQGFSIVKKQGRWNNVDWENLDGTRDFHIECHAEFKPRQKPTHAAMLASLLNFQRGVTKDGSMVKALRDEKHARAAEKRFCK